jgi:hypothetical protein
MPSGRMKRTRRVSVARPLLEHAVLRVARTLDGLDELQQREADGIPTEAIATVLAGGGGDDAGSPEVGEDLGQEPIGDGHPLRDTATRHGRPVLVHGEEQARPNGVVAALGELESHAVPDVVRSSERTNLIPSYLVLSCAIWHILATGSRARRPRRGSGCAAVLRSKTGLPASPPLGRGATGTPRPFVGSPLRP